MSPKNENVVIIYSTCSMFLLNNWSRWGHEINRKKHSRKALYSSCSLINVSRNPEIPNWFEKMLLTPFAGQILHWSFFTAEAKSKKVLAHTPSEVSTGARPHVKGYKYSHFKSICLSRFPETWIMPDKLRGVVLLNHLFCLLVFVGLKKSPIYFSGRMLQLFIHHCEAPEMFCRLTEFTQLSYRWGGVRQWMNFV